MRRKRARLALLLGDAGRMSGVEENDYKEWRASHEIDAGL